MINNKRILKTGGLWAAMAVATTSSNANRFITDPTSPISRPPRSRRWL